MAAAPPEVKYYMTTSMQGGAEQSADRTSGDWLGVGRRPLLKALGAGAALSAVSGVTTADDDGDDDDDEQPEGFEVEVLAPHATFSDDVGAALGVVSEDGDEDSIFLHDASTVVIARVSLEPGGSSGWHRDQGPVIASVVEGEVAVTHADGCVTRTYAAGEAAVVTGKSADEVANASDTEPAMAYVIFLGVPDGEPPSVPVEPPDC